MSNLAFHNDTIDLNTLWYNSHKNLIEKIAIELDHHDKIDELITKFIGTPHKFKKKKDPNLPKRARSSFIFFCNDRRLSITTKFPNLNMGSISKELAKIWNNYTLEDKEKYLQMHLNDKERYMEELEQYEMNKDY